MMLFSVTLVATSEVGGLGAEVPIYRLVNNSLFDEATNVGEKDLRSGGSLSISFAYALVVLMHSAVTVTS